MHHLHMCRTVATVSSPPPPISLQPVSNSGPERLTRSLADVWSLSFGPSIRDNAFLRALRLVSALRIPMDDKSAPKGAGSSSGAQK